MNLPLNIAFGKRVADTLSGISFYSILVLTETFWESNRAMGARISFSISIAKKTTALSKVGRGMLFFYCCSICLPPPLVTRGPIYERPLTKKTIVLSKVGSSGMREASYPRRATRDTRYTTLSSRVVPCFRSMCTIKDTTICRLVHSRKHSAWKSSNTTAGNWEVDKHAEDARSMSLR